MKKLLLSSNGDFAIEGLRLFFDDLKGAKLAYIITASKGASNLEYLKWHKDKMDSLGIDFEEIDIEGKNGDSLRELLKDKNTIWVEGGNTFYLLKAIRESGFDVVAKELIEKEIIYIGASAGSYVACPTIEMANWKKSGEEKNNFGVTDFTAMNLVPFLIQVHYEPEEKNIIEEKISQTKYQTKLLKDGQAILVEGDNYKLVGAGEEIIL